MTTWIKQNTVPEEVGNYNPTTKVLEVSKDLKIYSGYNFTKPVSAIVPTTTNTIMITIIGNVTLIQDLGSPTKHFKSVQVGQ
jgi:hypothetical protein